MKKTNRLAKIVGLLAVMAFLKASPTHATDTMRPAPAGLKNIMVVDPKRELPPGTALYNRSGKRVAIIRAYDRKHKFRQGQVGVGFLLQMITNGHKRWEYETLVYCNYFLKK